MDNDQLTDMSDEDFVATMKRLAAHAETRAEAAFKSGDRKAFDLWDYRASQLKNISNIEDLHEGLGRLRK